MPLPLACSKNLVPLQTYRRTLAHLLDATVTIASSGARTMSTVINAKGRSDLYVAGLKGIGYNANRHLGQ